jgi:hypothetical protein
VLEYGARISLSDPVALDVKIIDDVKSETLGGPDLTEPVGDGSTSPVTVYIVILSFICL